MRFFELTVEPKNPFTTYVKTDKPLGDDWRDAIVTLAASANLIFPFEARRLYDGRDGYHLSECDAGRVLEQNILPILI